MSVCKQVFDDCKLVNADLSLCNDFGAFSFARTDSSGAVFAAESSFEETDFSSAHVGAQFSGSDLKAVQFGDTDLSGCTMTDCDLAGQRLVGFRLVGLLVCVGVGVICI